MCARAPFVNRARSDVRMAGLAGNARIIAALARQLAGYQGIAVMVTNPVDVLSRLFAEMSGCERVYGVGSNTDTARYRLALSRLLAVPTAAVNGHVIGEHGDHAVICASSTTINGRPAAVPLQQVRTELLERPKRINVGIGRTRCGPAGATLAALEHALGVRDGVIELSTAWHGGWIGAPIDFASGRPTVRLPALNTAEALALAAAENKIRSAYEQIQLTKETAS